MNEVDYLKLTEQYASFLVAIGGVSITVLTLVLSLGSNVIGNYKPTEVNLRSFLVGALIVATVTCFIGAQMMTEAAAFIQNCQDMTPPVHSGDRLFLLASTNIFIAVILVFFAAMLLPTSSRRVHASIANFSGGIFLVIAIVAIYWAILAAYYRISLPQGGWAIWLPLFVAVVVGVILCSISITNKAWLWIAFTPSAFSTLASLVWFAWIFKEGNIDRLHGARIPDIWFFSFAITLSYAPLVVAGIKIMLGKEFAKGPLEKKAACQ